MIEMRWLLDRKKGTKVFKQDKIALKHWDDFGNWTLQYRYNALCQNASGALEPTDQWSDWIDVRYASEDKEG